jgi:hypothetical protein
MQCAQHTRCTPVAMAVTVNAVTPFDAMATTQRHHEKLRGRKGTQEPTRCVRRRPGVPGARAWRSVNIARSQCRVSASSLGGGGSTSPGVCGATARSH